MTANNMEYFKRERRGANYIFEKDVTPYENIIIEIPSPSVKHVLNDVGISATSNNVKFFYTFSLYPGQSDAIWISVNDKLVSNAARAIKIVNESDKKEKVCIRIIFK